jgi:putative transposase
MPWKETDAMNERSEFVLRAIATDNFRELCREYGISSKTGYKWKERFLEQGLAGMAEQSRRPDKSPNGLAESVVCEMIRIKEAHRTWGPRKIRELYARVHGRTATPSESSFKRVLERAGLVEKRRRRKREESGRLHSGRRATAPNEVWTVDFKGSWHGARGERCEPLTVRDEYSRYVLELRRLENARTQTVKTCFEELFRKHGLPGAIRSDNGPPFASVHGLLGLTRLSAWWLALGIDLERGRPGCPQDNGGHERLHLDIARELERARLGEEQAVLDTWRETFNRERPHEALGMRCPAELYTRSSRAFRGQVDDLDYQGLRPLRVTNAGCITLRGQWIFISGALAGWSVGLEPMTEALWNVWFGRLRLGQIDTMTMSFKSSEPATMRTAATDQQAA